MITVAAAAVGTIAVGAALLGAFDGTDGGDAAAIEGHVFRSVSVERDGHPVPAFDDAIVRLAIDRGSIGAYVGCNAIFGTLRTTPSRLRVSGVQSTLVGCGDGVTRRESTLAAFIDGDPTWRFRDRRLVLARGRTTITLAQDDLPPPLPRTNPARPRDLIDASLVTGRYREWPWGLAGDSGGDFRTVHVTDRGGRTVLSIRGRCRVVEAPVAVHRTTLTIGSSRTRAAPCRAGGSDDVMRLVSPFYGGVTAWHLDRGRLTLQRDRSTVTVDVR